MCSPTTLENLIFTWRMIPCKIPLNTERTNLSICRWKGKPGKANSYIWISPSVASGKFATCGSRSHLALIQTIRQYLLFFNSMLCTCLMKLQVHDFTSKVCLRHRVWLQALYQQTQWDRRRLVAASAWNLCSRPGQPFCCFSVNYGMQCLMTLVQMWWGRAQDGKLRAKYSGCLKHLTNEADRMHFGRSACNQIWMRLKTNGGLNS